MSQKTIQQLAPALWIGGGAFFFLAAALGKQPAFAGIGALFVILGVVFLVQARKATKS